MNKSEGARPAAAALTKLMEELADPDTRQAFAREPLETLKRLGITQDHLPTELLDVLIDCSYEELGLLLRIDSALTGAGMFIGAGSLPTLAKL